MRMCFLRFALSAEDMQLDLDILCVTAHERGIKLCHTKFPIYTHSVGFKILVHVRSTP